MSKHLSTPFRFGYVGSFLRPARLKEARQKFAEQAISGAELKAVENDCIRELVAKQKAAGYHVITDGEFRRATWHLDYVGRRRRTLILASKAGHCLNDLLYRQRAGLLLRAAALHLPQPA